MGAVADWAALKAAVQVPSWVDLSMRTNPGVMTSGGETFVSSWGHSDLKRPLPSSAPSTAVALTNADNPPITHPACSELITVGYLGGAKDEGTGSQYGPSGFLVDRLSHQGGLDGTLATEQTTNLPTAALTRYTDGVGVMIGLQVYSNLGSTITPVATISYTNTADTAGRSAYVRFSNTGRMYGGCIAVATLQAGDLGVKSVQSVTLSGSTGTAGNFGITLFKPLAFLPSFNGDPTTIVGWNSKIDTNAHLEFLAHVNTVYGSIQVSQALSFAQV